MANAVARELGAFRSETPGSRRRERVHLESPTQLALDPVTKGNDPPDGIGRIIDRNAVRRTWRVELTRKIREPSS